MDEDRRSQEELIEELRVTEELLRERNRVMEAIPPCPDHGAQCVPHALDWVGMAKRAIKAAQDARGFLALDGALPQGDVQFCRCVVLKNEDAAAKGGDE